MTTTFRIGVTRDFLKADGTLGFGDIGLDLLDEALTVEWDIEVASGRLPQYLVNPQAAEHPRFKEKLNHYRAIR